MVALVLLAAAAQAADLLTFAPAVARYGISIEANPVMAALYSAGGLAGVAAFKALVVLVAVLSVHAIEGAGGPPWIGVAVLAFATAVGLLGAATNLRVLWL